MTILNSKVTILLYDYYKKILYLNNSILITDHVVSGDVYPGQPPAETWKVENVLTWSIPEVFHYYF